MRSSNRRLLAIARAALATAMALHLASCPRAPAVYEREGVGPFLSQHVEFAAFSADAWSRDAQTLGLFRSFDSFVQDYRNLVGAAGGGSLHPPEEEAYGRLRRRTAAALLELAGEDLRGLTDAPLSSDPDARANQVIYQAVPRYFGARGLLLWVEPLALPPPGRIESGELADGTSTAPPIVELFENHRIDEVRSVEVELWGERVRFSELHVEGPVPLRPSGEASMGVVGQAVYDGIVLYHTAIDALAEAYTQTILGIRSNPGLALVAAQEWEEALLTGESFDPLDFAASKLKVREALELRSPAEFRGRLERWLTESTVVHEAYHVRDIRRRRWADMAFQSTQWTANVEVGAHLTSLAYGPTAGLRRQLAFLIAGATTPEGPLPLRMLSLWILARMLDEILAHPARYPAIRIVPVLRHPTAREQIAGQLYRLSPEQIRELARAVHRGHSTTFGHIHFPPDPTTEALYEGASLPPRSRWIWWTSLLVALGCGAGILARRRHRG